MNKIYTAKANALPFVEDPVGELYEDIYVVPVKNSKGEIENHLIQSGKFYIKENYYSENTNNLHCMDIMIDPETLVDITDQEKPIFVGCDLARELDSTFINGEYK